MSLLDRDHYEGNVLDKQRLQEARVAALERTELSGVAGPPGPQGPQGPVGSPGPGAPSPLTRGDVLVVDATPEITTLPIGTAYYIMQVNAGGTDPVWLNTLYNLGRVGIATATPAAKLQVGIVNHAADYGTGLIVYGGDGGAGTEVADFKGYTGTSALKIRGDGKVGIGIVNPTTELDVAGAIASTNDIRPDGIPTWGLCQRFIDRSGLASVTDHFRSNVIPTGYAWQGAPMGGTPTYMGYSALEDYFVGAANGAGVKHFLSKAITNNAAAWQGKDIRGRIRTGVTTEIGFRVDDGTDNNYAEIYVTGVLSNATQRLDFRYRIGGGAVTTVNSGLIIPCDTFIVVLLLCYWDGANYYINGYLIPEDSGSINIAGFSTGIVAWPPAAGRAGLFVKDQGNYASCDWFYNTFG